MKPPKDIKTVYLPNGINRVKRLIELCDESDSVFVIQNYDYVMSRTPKEFGPVSWVKRDNVVVFRNGDRPRDNLRLKLNLRHPIVVLYFPDGDMFVSVPVEAGKILVPLRGMHKL